MHPRAAELIRLLRLQAHPEGGYFAETFRSKLSVAPSDHRSSRAALTLIYFLLIEGTVSRWHRVLSDEAWHWYEGAGIELLTCGTEGGPISRNIVGPLSASAAPMRVVPAGSWQAARPLGPYALVGCSVGPGFDFADFTLLSSIPEADRPVMTPPETSAALL